MPIVVPEHPSPLANLLEQGTPLTNNLSEYAKKDLSGQLQRIHVEHSENIPKATAVTNSSKIAPVNLEMSFAAEQLEERSDCPASPFASNKGVIKTPPKTHKAKVPMKYNKFRKQYLLLMHGSTAILQSTNQT